MKTEEKLAVLKNIAAAFEKSGITWALGASALLYFKGIVPDFGDIDIVAAEEDIQKIKAALGSAGERKPENPANRRKARVYLEYRIGGVNVDIMAGLVFDGDHPSPVYALRAEDVKDFAAWDKTRIPLQSVEEWRTFYALMGRTEKVRLIDAYLGGREGVVT